MIRIRQHKVIAMTGMTTTTIIMFLITIIIIIHPKVRQFSKSVPLDFNTHNSSSSGNSDDDENDDHVITTTATNLQHTNGIIKNNK